MKLSDRIEGIEDCVTDITLTTEELKLAADFCRNLGRIYFIDEIREINKDFFIPIGSETPQELSELESQLCEERKLLREEAGSAERRQQYSTLIEKTEDLCDFLEEHSLESPTFIVEQKTQDSINGILESSGNIPLGEKVTDVELKDSCLQLAVLEQERNATLAGWGKSKPAAGVTREYINKIIKQLSPRVKNIELKGVSCKEIVEIIDLLLAEVGNDDPELAQELQQSINVLKTISFKGKHTCKEFMELREQRQDIVEVIVEVERLFLLKEIKLKDRSRLYSAVIKEDEKQVLLEKQKEQLPKFLDIVDRRISAVRKELRVYDVDKSELRELRHECRRLRKIVEEERLTLWLTIIKNIAENPPSEIVASEDLNKYLRDKLSEKSQYLYDTDGLDYWSGFIGEEISRLQDSGYTNEYNTFYKVFYASITDKLQSINDYKNLLQERLDLISAEIKLRSELVDLQELRADLTAIATEFDVTIKSSPSSSRPTEQEAESFLDEDFTKAVEALEELDAAEDFEDLGEGGNYPAQIGVIGKVFVFMGAIVAQVASAWQAGPVGSQSIGDGDLAYGHYYQDNYLVGVSADAIGGGFVFDNWVINGEDFTVMSNVTIGCDGAGKGTDGYRDPITGDIYTGFYEHTEGDNYNARVEVFDSNGAKIASYTIDSDELHGFDVVKIAGINGTVVVIAAGYSPQHNSYREHIRVIQGGLLGAIQDPFSSLTSWIQDPVTPLYATFNETTCGYVGINEQGEVVAGLSYHQPREVSPGNDVPQYVNYIRHGLFGGNGTLNFDGQLRRLSVDQDTDDRIYPEYHSDGLWSQIHHASNHEAIFELELRGVRLQLPTGLNYPTFRSLHRSPPHIAVARYGELHIVVYDAVSGIRVAVVDPRTNTTESVIFNCGNFASEASDALPGGGQNSHPAALAVRDGRVEMIHASGDRVAWSHFGLTNGVCEYPGDNVVPPLVPVVAIVLGAVGSAAAVCVTCCFCIMGLICLTALLATLFTACLVCLCVAACAVTMTAVMAAAGACGVTAVLSRQKKKLGGFNVMLEEKLTEGTTTPYTMAGMERTINCKVYIEDASVTLLEHKVGTVFSALRHGETVIQKVFSFAEDEKGTTEQKLAAFEREVEMMVTAKAGGHPNIIHIMSVVFDGENLRASIYMQAGKIENIIESRVKPSIKERLELMIGLLRGEEFLHGKKMVHGDGKLQNLCIGNDEHLKIIDFGNSHFEGDNVERGIVPGTFPYWPREVGESEFVFDTKELSMQADCYSWGLVLYELMVWKKLEQPELIKIQRSGLQRQDPEGWEDSSELGAVFKLVKDCTSKPRNERPTAEEGLEICKRALQSLKKSFKSERNEEKQGLLEGDEVGDEKDNLTHSFY